MLSLFRKSRKPLIFVTKKYQIKIDKKSDIILSPEFYWVKKIELNVLLKNEVKKMAPSIFEGSLPEGQYDYMVFKVSSKTFVIVAFDIENIKKELISLGVDLHLVDKIYLLQSEFLAKEISVKIDDNFSITTVDDIIIILPVKYCETQTTIDQLLIEHTLSNNYIFSSAQDKIKVDSKELNHIMVLLFLFLIFTTVKIVKIKNDINSLDEKRVEFIKKNNLPLTMLQIESIYNELKDVSKEQLNIREAITYLSKFKLNKDEYFQFISYEKNALFYKVKLIGKKRYDELGRFIKRANFKNLKIEAKK